jgi:hypothetical protein
VSEPVWSQTCGHLVNVILRHKDAVLIAAMAVVLALGPTEKRRDLVVMAHVLIQIVGLDGFQDRDPKHRRQAAIAVDQDHLALQQNALDALVSQGRKPAYLPASDQYLRRIKRNTEASR